MPKGYLWLPTNTPPQCKLTKWEKQSLQAEADRFVVEFYKPAIKSPPEDAQFNYIVDYWTKWHGAYLQFIAKYACPGPNAISPFFDSPFARLGYFGPNSWNLAARRHNDQWMVLGSGMTLRQCFDEMRTNPWFQP